MFLVCPNCHCDNQDMFVSNSTTTIRCLACDHEFSNAIDERGGHMIFKVRMEYRGVAAYEVEASDDETAEERAIDI